MDDPNRKSRLGRFQKTLSDHGIDAAMVWLPAHQLYLSGFIAHIYSRPIFSFITTSRSALVVPGLEEEHARSRGVVDQVLAYREMPGKARASGAEASAVAMLHDLLASLPSGATVGVESSVLPWRWGQIIADRGLQIADIGATIYGMREVKDQEEQRLLRISGRLTSIAVRDTNAAFRPGITEPLAELEGNRSALQMAAQEIPDNDISLGKVLTASGVEKAAMPHAYTTNRTITMPDHGIHRRHLPVDGYGAECERTFFVGTPSDELKRMFAVMREAQDAAIATLRAGVPAREVDDAARGVISAAGHGAYFPHRTGHSLGLEDHELPDMRHDSDRTLEAGMVVTIEPGIYVPGVGGVRHSDTFIISETSSECITTGAKDLESCIVWR